MTISIRYPNSGSSATGFIKVATYADLPVTGVNDGDLAITLDTDFLYAWNAATGTWLLLATPTGAIPTNARSGVILASHVALTATYNNGTLGVGATLTNAAALAALSIDSVSVSVGQRILIKDQGNLFENGVYTVTTVGSGAVAWVLTRATDYDTAAKAAQASYTVAALGTYNTGRTFIQSTSVTTMGTDAITLLDFSTGRYSGVFGVNHIIAANYSLVSGSNHVITAGAVNAACVGGDSNFFTSAGLYSVAVGGERINLRESHSVGWGEDTDMYGDHCAGGGEVLSLDGSHNFGHGKNCDIGASSSYSTVFGYLCQVAAACSYSHAVGRRAKANHPGAQVYSDSQDADFASTVTNQWRGRFQNGFHLDTSLLWINNSTALGVGFCFEKKGGSPGGFIWDASLGVLSSNLGNGQMQFVTQNGYLQCAWKDDGSSNNFDARIDPINDILTESTTSRTLAITDSYRYIRTTNGSTTTITVPANGTVAFSIGTVINFIQGAAGQGVFAAAGGVTINSKLANLKLAAQYAVCTLKKVDTNVWDLFGDLVA